MSKTKNKKEEKIELSQGGMRSPGRTLWGKILIWFLTIAMLSTGLVFLIYRIIYMIFRQV